MRFTDKERRNDDENHGQDALADPLESEDWRGLLWLTPALVLLASAGWRKGGAVRRPRPDFGVDQTRTPSFTR